MSRAAAARLLRERLNTRIAQALEAARPRPRHLRLCGCCDGWWLVAPRWLCVACRRLVSPTAPCPTCGDEPVRLGYHVRVPRRTASAKTWRLFLARFVGPDQGRRSAPGGTPG